MYRVLDALDDMVCLLDASDQTILYANAALRANTGLAELMGKPVSVLTPTHDASEWRDVLAGMDEQGQGVVNAEFVLAGGLDVVAAFNRVREGECVLLTLHDLGSVRGFQSRINRVLRFYRALLMVNQEILRKNNTEQELYALVCKAMVEQAGVTLAWVGGVIPDTMQVQALARYGEGGDYLDEVSISIDADLPSGQGATGYAFRTGEPQVENDWHQSRRVIPWLQAAASRRWRSSASFPVFRGGKVSVVLGLYHVIVDAFDSEIVQLADAMSGALSHALENMDRERERQAMAERIRLSALVFEHSDQPMMVTNSNNDIITVNAAYERMTGYSVDELRGKNPRILASGRHDAKFYDRMWQSLRQSNFWQGQVWVKRKNGEIFPEWLTINVVRDQQERVLRYVATSLDISEKVRQEEVIWKQANIDTLTGLVNRYRLTQLVTQQLENNTRNMAFSFCLLYIDLDGFREINDVMGHDTGDAILVEVARRIVSCVGDSGVAARLGGDEFAVLLPDAGQTRGQSVALCILGRIEEPYAIEGQLRQFFVSSSIGMACYPQDAHSVVGLLKKTEQAMYDAKKQGGNRLSVYMQGMQEQAEARMGLLQDMRDAVAQRQFRLFYQPVVDMKSGLIVKAEALIRWMHPVQGMISPAEFIPLAEQSGLIVPIGEWVFREAVGWIREMRDAGVRQVSVNVSPVQFRDDRFQVQTWLDYLRQMGVAPGNIVVEITEGLLMDIGHAVGEKLLAFRNAGIQVALDDFGTGYSSLAYLKRFDIDYLKIDQSFVRGLTAMSDDMVLVEAIISMAHKLGLKVIAEGVEMAEQHLLLKDLQNDYGQGYWYARPMDAQSFRGLLPNFCLHDLAACGGAQL